MRKISLFLSCIIFATVSFCQDKHVNWEYEAKKKTVDTYDIIITANVENKWHVYSQQGKGPNSTSIDFKTNPLISRIGAIKEIGDLERSNDKYLGEILSYTGKVQFVQTVKVKGNFKTNLSGNIQFVVCDDSRCLPRQKKSFDLKLP